MTTKRINREGINKIREKIIERAKEVVIKEKHAWFMTFCVMPGGAVTLAPFCGNPNELDNRNAYGEMIHHFCRNKFPVAVIQVSEGWQVPCKDEHEHRQIYMEWDDIRQHPEAEERLNIVSFERNNRGRKYERITSFKIVRGDDNAVTLGEREDVEDAKIEDPVFSDFLCHQPDPEQYIVLSDNAVYDPELDTYFLGTRNEYMPVPHTIPAVELKMMASKMLDDSSAEKLPEGMVDWIKSRLHSDPDTFANDVLAIAEHMEINGRSAYGDRDDGDLWESDPDW